MTTKITIGRAVVEQVLGVWSGVCDAHGWDVDHCTPINALREALMQQPAEPVGREPLTDEQIDGLCPKFEDPMRREMWIAGFKIAHGIGGKS